MPDESHPDTVVNPFHECTLQQGVSVDSAVREQLRAAAEILRAQSDGDAAIDPTAALHAITEILAGLTTGRRDGTVEVRDPQALDVGVEQLRRPAGHLLPEADPGAE